MRTISEQTSVSDNGQSTQTYAQIQSMYINFHFLFIGRRRAANSPPSFAHPIKREKTDIKNKLIDHSEWIKYKWESLIIMIGIKQSKSKWKESRDNIGGAHWTITNVNRIWIPLRCLPGFIRSLIHCAVHPVRWVTWLRWMVNTSSLIRCWHPCFDVQWSGLTQSTIRNRDR